MIKKRFCPRDQTNVWGFSFVDREAAAFEIKSYFVMKRSLQVGVFDQCRCRITNQLNDKIKTICKKKFKQNNLGKKI